MKLLRNPEVKRGAAVYLSLTAVVCAAALLLFGAKCGAVAAAVCVVFDAAALSGSVIRFRKIRQMCSEIDSMLHSKSYVELSSYSEGELSILRDELSKVISMLRENADSMLRDRQYLSDSIADISHQIRTPLTSVNILLSMLSGPDVTDERRSELIGEVSGQLLKIDWLINTLLKISKLDAHVAVFDPAPVGLLPLVQKAVSPLLISLDLHDQKLSLDIPGDISITADVPWTSEAICNIIKNCMEHTPAGGSIRVEAMSTPVFTQLTVTDTGSGISGEDLPHLFERFYRGKGSSDSSVGIGLALARMILSEQNATVKADNSPEGGACFTIKFYSSIV